VRAVIVWQVRPKMAFKKKKGMDCKNLDWIRHTHIGSVLVSMVMKLRVP
jgi:hypothetical protein